MLAIQSHYNHTCMMRRNWSMTCDLGCCGVHQYSALLPGFTDDFGALKALCPSPPRQQLILCVIYFLSVRLPMIVCKRVVTNRQSALCMVLQDQNNLTLACLSLAAESISGVSSPGLHVARRNLQENCVRAATCLQAIAFFAFAMFRNSYEVVTSIK